MQMRPLEALRADDTLKKGLLFGSTPRLVADVLSGTSVRRQNNSSLMLEKKAKKNLKVEPTCNSKVQRKVLNVSTGILWMIIGGLYWYFCIKKNPKIS